jgi:hypothetical protein
MTERTKWGVPRSSATPGLRPLTQLFPGETKFEKAEPITVRLRGVEVREDEDNDFLFIPNKNDVIVVSSFQFDSQPPVQRLHYMRKGQELGRIVPIFKDVVFSLDGLSADYKILTLRIQVYDVDGMSDEMIQEITTLSTNAAKMASVFFPQLTLIASGVALALPPLLKLINNLNNHDKIIDESLQLEIGSSGIRDEILQPGYFICFKRPQPEGLDLNDSLQVTKFDGSVFTDCSYAIFDIRRDYWKEVQTWAIDQKMAKIIAELDGKGQSEKAPIDFLRETLTAYTKWENLKRATSIREIPEVEKTQAQKDLLSRLLEDADVAGYLTA